MDYEVVRQGMEQAIPYNRYIGLERGRGRRRPRRGAAAGRDELHNHVGSQHAGALFSAGEAASGATFVGAFAERLGEITPLARTAKISYLKLATGPDHGHGHTGRGEAGAAGSPRRGRQGRVPGRGRRSPTSDGKTVAAMTVDWHVRKNANERAACRLLLAGRRSALRGAPRAEALERRPCGPAASSASYIFRTRLKICSAISWDCSRVGFSTCRTRAARRTEPSPSGSAARLRSRTCWEPWIATGTTGTPDSSASRPSPGLGSPSFLVRERPPSPYISTIPPRSSTVCAVLKASSSRFPRSTGNTPPWLIDEVEDRRLEELGLRHEMHLAAQQRGDEEVIHEAEVVGRQRSPAPLRARSRRRSRAAGRSAASATSARCAPACRRSPAGPCARARGTCRRTRRDAGRCTPGASTMGVATPAAGLVTPLSRPSPARSTARRHPCSSRLRSSAPIRGS